MRLNLIIKTLSILYIILSCFPSASQIQFSEQLYQVVLQKYGEEAVQRVKQWQNLIDNKSTNTEEQLFQVNRFFNQLTFVDDIIHWQQKDYWATPVEFLGTNAGDCEDFAIAKFFTLVAMGVPQEKLRFMYVTATQPTRQAHMVLAYYEQASSVPLVLDNINKRILSASQRRDLIPIYSFNGDGLWLAKIQGTGRKIRKNNNNNMWDDLNRRMQEGN